MGKIWQDENRFSIWLEIELLALEAQAELGVVPADVPAKIRSKARFDVKRINEIEEETKHDVIAFLTNVAEYVGPDSRFVHLGMTSSDVLDTCLAVQMKQAGEILLKALQELRDVLGRRAKEFKLTMTIGRSHGVHAEPTTFGLKLALWREEVKRNIERMERAIETISFGKISGAVGTYEHLSPRVEEYVCKKLGLQPAPVSTQVLQRDRHAEYMTTLALVGATLEKIAIEIRHLQRTEVREVEEFFSAGQKGSSAMPHKRNPILSERITGIARLLRANAMAALENVALWHERDISHSSVERVIIPDSTIILDYALSLTTQLIDKLLVYPEAMQKNLFITKGLVFSQCILLALAKAGMSREDAYKVVQRNAMAVWEEGKDFMSLLKADTDVKKYLHDKAIEEAFDPKQAVRHVDTIFTRCGLT